MNSHEANEEYLVKYQQTGKKKTGPLSIRQVSVTVGGLQIIASYSNTDRMEYY